MMLRQLSRFDSLNSNIQWQIQWVARTPLLSAEFFQKSPKLIGLAKSGHNP